MSVNIILLVISAIVSLCFLIFLLKGKRYNDMISSLDNKDFPLCELYGIGFFIMDLIKIDFNYGKTVQIRKEIVILYGEKYGEYYLRVIYAQKITLSFMIFLATALISTLAEGFDGYILFIAGTFMAGAIYYYYSENPAERIKKRSIKYLSEFPNAISTIALMVNAGMVLREAWQVVSNSKDGELYDQMRMVNENISNGMSEIDAFYAFSNQCATPEIRKFTSLIVQGMEKGNKELAGTLKKLSDELWENKKQYVLQQGELASSKLLIPIMSMFIGILIMVIGPIMTNLGM